MWKIAVIVALSLAPIAVSGQEQAPASEGQRETRQALPPSTVTTNQSGTYYEQKREDKPQGWHKFITWPEGIVTWAIIFTLGAIVWQAIETRRAIEVQIIATQPWFSVKNVAAIMQENKLCCQVDIVNGSRIPCMFLGLSLKVNNQTVNVDTVHWIVPDEPYTAGFDIVLTANQAAQIKRGKKLLGFPMMGDIRYGDNFDNFAGKRTQMLTGTLFYSPKRGATFLRAYAARWSNSAMPPEPTEEDETA